MARNRKQSRFGPWGRRIEISWRKLAKRLREHPAALSEDLSHFQRTALRYTKIFLILARMDVLNQVKLHAQALTFATLLALVPLLAVALSVTKALGGFEGADGQIEAFIMSNLAGTESVREAIAGPLQGFIKNIHAGQVGALSILLLIWSVMSLLGHIETAFNRIFGTPTRRAFVTRLLTYWAILTLGPVLLAASFAATAALQSSTAAGWLENVGLGTRTLVQISPLLTTWLALTVMYAVVPNTRVHLPSALTAAILSGTLWNLAKFGYAIYAKNALTLHNIYGSLAVIPLFILWLYVSWLLVLFGAHLTFAFQHWRTYHYEESNRIDNHRVIQIAACRLMLEIAHEFRSGQAPTHPENLAIALKLPARLFEKTRESLIRGKFIHELQRHGALVPARRIEEITLGQILNHLQSGQGSQPTLARDTATKLLTELLDDVDDARHQLTWNVDFGELVERSKSNRPAKRSDS